MHPPFVAQAPNSSEMTEGCCSKEAHDCPMGGGGPFKTFCPFSLALFAGTGYSYLRYMRAKKSLSDAASQPRPVVFAGVSRRAA